jgi:hypothetical protein
MSSKLAYAAIALLLAAVSPAIGASHSAGAGNAVLAQYRLDPGRLGGPAMNRHRDRSLDWFYDHAKGPVA